MNPKAPCKDCPNRKPGCHTSECEPWAEYEDYNPRNCRWASRKEQANNRRNTVYVTIDGVTKTISGWAEFSGLKRSTINNRYVDGVRGIALLHRADDTRFPKGYNRYGNSRHYDDYDDCVTAPTIIEAEGGAEE